MPIGWLLVVDGNTVGSADIDRFYRVRGDTYVGTRGLGCGAFGSEIRTPNIDGLARQGRIYTNMYATTLCAITRAELLSGTDHHLVTLDRHFTAAVDGWTRDTGACRR